MNRVIRALSLHLVLVLFGSLPAVAGELSRVQVEQRFRLPIHVQEKLTGIPVWPLTSDLEPGVGPVGYAFESIDLAPLPGFAGTPINLLVTIDHNGTFLDVEILNQREPILVGVLGEEPLREFVRQYAGKNLKQEISVGSGQRTGQAPIESDRARLDGITRATTSVRIVNQTVLASALAVARAKLGFTGEGKSAPARVRPDVFSRHTFAQLIGSGMIARLHVTNALAERAFAGSEGAGADPEILARPDDTLVELYVAYLNAPTIGRSLLGDAAYSELMGRIEDGQQIFWVATAGRETIVDDGFIPAGVPQRLALSQDQLPIELRDLIFAIPTIAGAPEFNASRIFSVYAGGGLDPGRATEFVMTLTRVTRKGFIIPRTVQQSVSLKYSPVGKLFDYPPRPLPEWTQAWKAVWPMLVVIASALALLTVALRYSNQFAANGRRLAIFRWGFLVFTLVYLGWYAQGQLSVVQLTGVIKSITAGQGFGSILYDPVSVLIIVFTLVTFVAWGRGTFCGWLCPFGAMQEIVASIGRNMRLPKLHLPRNVTQRLEYLPSIFLAVLVVTALISPQLADSLVEVEPFKTAITASFNRSWPYVAYAVLMLALCAVYFKFYCRFVCPLATALMLGGKLRRLNWISRREVCGQPCQTCSAKCHYDAIAQDGSIRYDNCFQCLECVGIYNDDQRCAPILLYKRKGLVMAPTGIRRGGSSPKTPTTS